MAVLLVEPAMVRSAFPSSAQMPARGDEAKRRQFKRECAQVAGIQFLFALPCVWAFAFLAPMFDTFYADLLRNQSQAPGGPWSGIINVLLLIGMILVGVITGVTILRGSTEALRWFVRLFYGYLVMDMLSIVWMMLFFAKYLHIAAALLALPVVAWLPFYQRQVARRLLGKS